jgi:hypothetical protein
VEGQVTGRDREEERRRMDRRIIGKDKVRETGRKREGYRSREMKNNRDRQDEREEGKRYQDKQ